MMSTQKADILKCVIDYEINLIEPVAMGADNLDKFHSNLRLVLGFIKYFNDGDELDAFFSRERELEAARVIKECANTEIKIDEKAKVIDVCKAEREIREKVRLETLKNDVRNVMESFKVNVGEVMKVLKIREEDQAILIKMI